MRYFMAQPSFRMTTYMAKYEKEAMIKSWYEAILSSENEQQTSQENETVVINMKKL